MATAREIELEKEVEDLKIQLDSQKIEFDLVMRMRDAVNRREQLLDQRERLMQEKDEQIKRLKAQLETNVQRIFLDFEEKRRERLGQLVSTCITSTEEQFAADQLLVEEAAAKIRNMLHGEYTVIIDAPSENSEENKDEE